MLLVRLSRRGTPQFQHLDEVPMVRGGAGGGEGGFGGGSRSRVQALTSLSFSSSSEQSVGGVLCPHPQLTPPCSPPGLPTLLNKEAAALALVSRLPCALQPARGKPLLPREAPATFGVPRAGLAASGCSRAGGVGAGCAAVVPGLGGAAQPPRRGGMGGSERPGTHIAFLLLRCTRPGPRSPRGPGTGKGLRAGPGGWRRRGPPCRASAAPEIGMRPLPVLANPGGVGAGGSAVSPGSRGRWVAGVRGWVINVAPVGSRLRGRRGLGAAPRGRRSTSLSPSSPREHREWAGGAPKPEVGAEPGRDPVTRWGGARVFRPRGVLGVSLGCPQPREGGPRP